MTEPEVIGHMNASTSFDIKGMNMETNTEKQLFKVRYGSFYIRSVEVLLERLKEGDARLNPYKIPMIITSAAALETILNEAIMVECRNRFPEKDIKRLTNAQLGMSLGGKLDNLGWLLTDNTFVINNESEIYQCLKSIIRYRNEVMHRKDYYREVEFEVRYEKMEEGFERWVTWEDHHFDSMKASHDLITIDEYEKFYRAISELDITIINITTIPPIIENDLFTENK